MSDNMPKVIDSIINSEYTDVDVLKQECKKLVDSINYSEKRGIEIDIQPEKSIESFSLTEKDIIKTIQHTSKLFIDSMKKLEKTFEKATPTTTLDHSIKYLFSPSSKASTIFITDNKVLLKIQPIHLHT